jgi:hypothetical protein
MDLESALAGSTFQFYGRPIRQVWVAKDGYVSFAQDSPDPDGALQPGAFDRDIAHMGLPPPRLSVMAFWDSLSLRPFGVCYEIDGEAPHQQLRFTWESACLTPMCGTDDLNFTITLDETTQRVALNYDRMYAGNADGANGLNATVGLVDDATGCAVKDCVLATGLCAGSSTPCGYSQVFSNTIQSPQVPNMQFIPVVDPGPISAPAHGRYRTRYRSCKARSLRRASSSSGVRAVALPQRRTTSANAARAPVASPARSRR